MLSDNQRNHHRKKKIAFLKLLLLLLLQRKVFVNFHPCPIQKKKKILRCSFQVWGSCFDYRLFEYYVSSQTATFCCRQMELFSYKYRQCFSYILITNINGHLTIFFFSPHESPLDDLPHSERPRGRSLNPKLKCFL